MIKNIYEPDNEDILFWLAHNEKMVVIERLKIRHTLNH